MKRIVKLTNHVLTDVQEEGLLGYEIVFLPNSIQGKIAQCGETIAELNSLALQVTRFVKRVNATLVLSPGGSPAFNAILSVKLARAKIVQVFSHSVREYTENVAADGSVTKTNIFKHVSFINLPVIMETVRQYCGGGADEHEHSTYCGCPLAYDGSESGEPYNIRRAIGMHEIVSFVEDRSYGDGNIHSSIIFQGQYMDYLKIGYAQGCIDLGDGEIANMILEVR